MGRSIGGYVRASIPTVADAVGGRMGLPASQWGECFTRGRIIDPHNFWGVRNEFYGRKTRIFRRCLHANNAL